MVKRMTAMLTLKMIYFSLTFFYSWNYILLVSIEFTKLLSNYIRRTSAKYKAISIPNSMKSNTIKVTFYDYVALPFLKASFSLIILNSITR